MGPLNLGRAIAEAAQRGSQTRTWIGEVISAPDANGTCKVRVSGETAQTCRVIGNLQVSRGDTVMVMKFPGSAMPVVIGNNTTTVNTATPTNITPMPVGDSGLPTNPNTGDAPVWDGAAWAAVDVATQAELDAHTEGNDLHHSPVTLDPASDAKLSLTGQQLKLDPVAAENHGHSGYQSALPSITGHGNQFLRVNVIETGFEYANAPTGGPTTALISEDGNDYFNQVAGYEGLTGLTDTNTDTGRLYIYVIDDMYNPPQICSLLIYKDSTMMVGTEVATAGWAPVGTETVVPIYAQNGSGIGGTLRFTPSQWGSGTSFSVLLDYAGIPHARYAHTHEDGGTTDHAALTHLDYASSGHTGFSASDHNHDATYVKQADHTTAAHDALGIDAATVGGHPASDFAASDHAHAGQFLATIEGSIAVAGGRLRFYNKLGRTVTITKVFCACEEPPAGAALIFDVNKNGTTIFTNQAHRPQIAIGQNTGETTDIDVNSLADGDYLTIDVDQIGSDIAGSDASIHICYA
jgi:hypothetical protein